MNRIKKPFYKKWWFWVIIVVLVIGIGGSQVGKKSESNTSTSNKTGTVSKTVSSKASSSTIIGWTQSDYDNLVTGDLANYGNGGSKYTDIVSKFGKPSTSSESTVNGAKTKVCVWTNIKDGSFGSAVSLSFTSKDGNDNDLLLVSKAKNN
ncbi:MAG: hypothetical protein ABF913_03150 [Oenococcus sp.]|uniref:hypothetical protein n=1 Tax=Lactobacillaceae TaxID=33958 RepID=UPI0039EB42F5